jgi:hypothetical protein
MKSFRGTLARFDSNGRLDSTFATGGLTALPLTFAGAIALQSDGKILIASASDFNPGGGNGGSIARFNPNGTLDKTFGLFGQVASIASGGVFDTTGTSLVSGIVSA